MCKFCDYSTEDISDLKIHMKIHENVLPIALLTPKISQTKIINKIRSERKHHEMLKCPKEDCNFETPYYKKLQAHLKCKYLPIWAQIVLPGFDTLCVLHLDLFESEKFEFFGQ